MSDSLAAAMRATASITAPASWAVPPTSASRYDADSAESWPEIALVVKRLQTEEERVNEKEETKDQTSVLKRLPR